MFFGRCDACGKKGDDLAHYKPCQSALYCNIQCQLAHLEAHRAECERRQAQFEEDRAHGRQVHSCTRCISKGEVRYFTFPMFQSKNGVSKAMPWTGKKMCGKCVSYLGIDVPNDQWFYQDPDVARRYAKENPFEHICAHCKKGKCNFACPDCERVWYCGEDCRMQHFAKHERNCLILRRRPNSEAAGTL